MANASKLLDHLSALTAIRDLELLEFSLLKTLHHSFQPLGLALLRLDATGQPQMEIVRLLESRLAEYRNNPATAAPWAEVKARLRAARGE